MISLTLRAATMARTRGSKRLTAAHLKQAVGMDEHFDFLSEVVSKIPDAPTSKEPPAPAGKGEKKQESKQESDGDDWDAKEEVKPKRKRAAAAGGAAGGRKRKAKGGDD